MVQLDATLNLLHCLACLPDYTHYQAV